jgi:hypothetical protein
LPEDLLLDLEFLEGGLDDQLGVGNGIEGVRGGDPGQCRSLDFRRDDALLDQS